MKYRKAKIFEAVIMRLPEIPAVVYRDTFLADNYENCETREITCFAHKGSRGELILVSSLKNFRLILTANGG